MNRAEFARRLRQGLKALPGDDVAEIVADYDSYFEEGTRAGRSDEQMIAALGNPARLAAEICVATHAEAWRTAPTRTSAASTLASAFGLLALDGLLLLPLGIALLFLGVGLIASVVFVLYGLVTLIAGPFDAPLGGPLAAVLRGTGLLAGGVAGLAVVTLLTRLLVDACARRARPHFLMQRQPKDRPELT